MKNSFYILILGISGIIGGGFNYLYHPLLLRLLSVEDFGTFQSLFGIFNIFSIIIISLSIYLVKEIAKDTKQSNLLEKQSVLKKDITKLTFGMLGVYFIFSFFINQYLKIYNFSYFLLLSLSVLFINLELYIFPFLQGLKKFEAIGFLRVIAPTLRIIIGVGLVYLGFGIYGAIGGFVISQILFIIIGFKYMRKYIPYKKTENPTKTTFLFENISNLKYFFFASIILTLFQNIDILIVKNMFDGETAGYYAAVSVLAKFLVFLGMSIETVYYPQLVKETVFPIKQILKISGYYVLMTLGALGFFWLFGEVILRLFKDGLQEYLYLVFPLIIYCGILAYTSIIVKTLIAFEKYIVNYLLAGVIFALIVSLYTFADSIMMLSYIFAVFAAIGLGIAMLSMYLSNKSVKDS